MFITLKRRFFFLIQTDREIKREINETRESGFRFFECAWKKVN